MLSLKTNARKNNGVPNLALVGRAGGRGAGRWAGRTACLGLLPAAAIVRLRSLVHINFRIS